VLDWQVGGIVGGGALEHVRYLSSGAGGPFPGPGVQVTHGMPVQDLGPGLI
jgi:hypothetical protein